MSGQSHFNPADLVSLKDLIAEGMILYTFETAKEYARQGRFPAVKVAGIWYSTRAAAKAHVYKGANAAFRRLSA